MDTTALQNILTNISSRRAGLATKKVVDPAQLATLENDLNNVDTTLATIVATPDPGPRTDLDFSVLDANVLAFKSSSVVNQSAVNNVGQLVKLNTPR